MTRYKDLKSLKSFIKKYTPKTETKVKTISQDIIHKLNQYHWPGNVRELENIIERAIIVSPADKIIIGDWFSREYSHQGETENDSLEAVEKKHILETLEKTNWRVSGDNGAAKILGLKRTTLEARMRKLGISKRK